MSNPTPAPDEVQAAMEACEYALVHRPGAGNLIGGRFIADPPVTVSADHAGLLLSLARQAARWRTALEPFAGMCAFIEALRENEQDEPLEPLQIVMQSMGSGASNCLTWKDFMEARAALTQEEG